MCFLISGRSGHFGRNVNIRFEKPVVFISARVHAGEIPSSHMLAGLVDFLRKPFNAQAGELLKQFVFKLVPMINVDGVYRGFRRSDIYSNDLNRQYRSPDPLK